MANQTPIARWALNNRGVLNPSFVRFDWPDRYFSGVFDFAATISIDGTTGSGRGIDFNQELALEKAVAEAIERYICRMLRVDSVGMSVSGENGSAVEHARHEALERHFFNEHRRLEMPFLPLIEKSSEFAMLNEINFRFERQNKGVGQLAFFKMNTPAPYHGYVAVIQTAGEALCLGLSLHADPRRAIPRAFFEAMTNFTCFRDDPKGFEIQSRQNEDLWNCNPDFLSGIRKLFAGKTSELAPLAMPRLERVEIDISKMTKLAGCPIAPVKFIAVKE